MKQRTIDEVADHLPELFNLVLHDRERVTLNGDGGSVVIISREDYNLLEGLEAEEDRLDIAEARRILADPEERSSIPLQQAIKELGCGDDLQG